MNTFIKQRHPQISFRCFLMYCLNIIFKYIVTVSHILPKNASRAPSSGILAVLK